MIAMIELDYDQANRVRTDRDLYERVRVALPQLTMEEWKEDVEKPPYFYPGKFMIDLVEDAPFLSNENLQFSVKRFRGTYKVQGTSPSTGNTTNLQIAIPAIGLLAMDEVLLLDDACTDSLNDHLQEGWRIIAVCPPDAQRRPDYIMGRSAEMRDKHGK